MKRKDVVYKCLLCGGDPGGVRHGPDGHPPLLYAEGEDGQVAFVTMSGNMLKINDG